jgi:hypothetical protein
MTQYAAINIVTPGGIRIEPYIAPGFDIHPAFMQHTLKTIEKLTPTQQRQLAYACIAAKSAESLPTLFP